MQWTRYLRSCGSGPTSGRRRERRALRSRWEIGESLAGRADPGRRGYQTSWPVVVVASPGGRRQILEGARLARRSERSTRIAAVLLQTREIARDSAVGCGPARATHRSTRPSGVPRPAAPSRCWDNSSTATLPSARRAHVGGPPVLSKSGRPAQYVDAVQRGDRRTARRRRAEPSEIGTRPACAEAALAARRLSSRLHRASPDGRNARTRGIRLTATLLAGPGARGRPCSGGVRGILTADRTWCRTRA